jgi:hypothetical protein
VIGLGVCLDIWKLKLLTDLECEMNSSVLVTAALLSAAISASSYAAPVAKYTMTNAVVTQKTAVSGCSALSTGGVATATFNEDVGSGSKTYVISRTGYPDQTGEWAVINSSSSYTVYMLPDDAAMSSLFDAFNVAILANCQLKYPTATVSVISPSVMVKKNTMIVKNSNKSAVATFQLKGKQENTFKGTTKVGNFSSTITIKGNVEAAP